jgi:hypothetical protein
MPTTDPQDFPRITHTYRRNRSRPDSGLLSIVVCIGLFFSGYLIGREHLKYELRSVMQEAGEAIKGLGNPFMQNPNGWKPKTKQASPTQLSTDQSPGFNQ